MFQSLTYVKYSYRKGRHLYILIDSDFETEIAMIAGWRHECGSAFGNEIAKEYEKRNLNPAANLALYYNSVQSKYNKWSLDYTVEYDLQHSGFTVKEFYGKYLADIKKYMALL